MNQWKFWPCTLESKRVVGEVGESLDKTNSPPHVITLYGYTYERKLPRRERIRVDTPIFCLLCGNKDTFINTTSVEIKKPYEFIAKLCTTCATEV